LYEGEGSYLDNILSTKEKFRATTVTTTLYNINIDAAADDKVLIIGITANNT
jgi:hypothetical protein